MDNGGKKFEDLLTDSADGDLPPERQDEEEAVFDDEQEQEEEALSGVDKSLSEDEGIQDESQQDEASEPSMDVLELASDIPVQLVAVMGKKSITMKDVAGLRVGKVVELDRPLSEVVDIVANGKLIARGELVDIDGRMGVRIIKLVR